ncbi:MAG: soluble NSF attachment family protein [Bacteroidales bacterium]|nr:soluble NSF attachment family protein [Bacteroidales bacterium]
MAKSKKEDPRAMEGFEESLTKTEQFLENNWKTITYGLAVIAVIVAAVWLYNKRLDNKTEEALSQMYVAENYFAEDSLQLALYGDGNYLGFIDIADEYSATKPGNLAYYYAGVCLLRAGEFEDAIVYLNKYKKKDKSISPVAIGCIGDAYVELGNTEIGIEYYLKAADYSENKFYNPLYLMKAAQIYEMEGSYDKALELYEEIKEKYPESSEGRNIDKYIARAKIRK